MWARRTGPQKALLNQDHRRRLGVRRGRPGRLKKAHLQKGSAQPTAPGPKEARVPQVRRLREPCQEKPPTQRGLELRPVRRRRHARFQCQDRGFPQSRQAVFPWQQEHEQAQGDIQLEAPGGHRQGVQVKAVPRLQPEPEHWGQQLQSGQGRLAQWRVHLWLQFVVLQLADLGVQVESGAAMRNCFFFLNQLPYIHYQLQSARVNLDKVLKVLSELGFPFNW